MLLLNSVLTVEAKKIGSHQNLFKKDAWENFTDAVIELVSEKMENVVFILWGKAAQQKGRKVDESKSMHKIIKGPHPSPINTHGNFVGGDPFFKPANDFLTKNGKTPIDWCRL